ncbi:MAG TPA: NUDIX domain-containing protein [Candidatus Acidoferrum sp.]|nr:NUDIX domain-containing protein [Candidatus Acidoferrum sp.]
MAPQKPSVGVGVMVVKDGKVLLTKRRGSHGAGQYAFPGGHLEYMESFAACARRETREECGIEITNIRFQFVRNLTEYAPKHYVHLALVADWQAGEPTLLEPDKAEAWQWHKLDELPNPLFETCQQAIWHYQYGGDYFDAVQT